MPWQAVHNRVGGYTGPKPSCLWPEYWILITRISPELSVAEVPSLLISCGSETCTSFQLLHPAACGQTHAILLFPAPLPVSSRNHCQHSCVHSAPHFSHPQVLQQWYRCQEEAQQGTKPWQPSFNGSKFDLFHVPSSKILLPMHFTYGCSVLDTAKVFKQRFSTSTKLPVLQFGSIYIVTIFDIKQLVLTVPHHMSTN